MSVIGVVLDNSQSNGPSLVSMPHGGGTLRQEKSWRGFYTLLVIASLVQEVGIPREGFPWMPGPENVDSVPA